MPPSPVPPASDAISAYGERRYADAVAAWRQALAEAAARGETESLLWRAHLGHALLGFGDLPAANAEYAHVLAAARPAGDTRAFTAALAGSAYLAQARGQYAAAEAAFRDAADVLAVELADPLGAAWTLTSAAAAAYLAGDSGRAVADYARALPALRAGASPDELAGALTNYGGILLAARETHQARALLDEAARLRTPASDRSLMEVSLRLNRGMAALMVGEFVTAEADLAAAYELGRALGATWEAAKAAASLSNLFRYRGDLARALAFHADVMALEAAGGFVVDEPGGLLYAGLEDHALHLEVAKAGADRIAGGGRQLPEADTTATVAAALAQRSEAAPEERRALARDDTATGPFVVFSPPCPGTFGPLFPRGAAAIASFLNHHGVPAVLVPLSHYVDVYLGQSAVDARLAEVVADAIATLRPRAIGISVTFSYLYPQGLALARLLRAAAPNTPIIIGGPHVTYWDEECLREAPAIDVVVRGEGEWTALELLQTLARVGHRAADADLSQVLGLTWRAPDGTIRANRLRPLGNVLALPEIDFGLLPAAFAKRMEISGMTSRGCTFRCRYCHEYRFWGGVVRQYPVARVVGEMERIARDHGNAMAGIDDSMLSMEDAYFGELCRALAASRWLPPQFGFLTRVDTITPEGLTAMREAHLRSMSVGLESGSDKVLLAMNKGVTLARARVGLELARAAEVQVAGFFIVGHPGDDAHESATTVDWVEDLFDQGLLAWMDVAMFTPYPGTPFFAHPDKHGVRILTMDWSRWRRTNRPVAELTTYRASAIYKGYLEMLAAMSRRLRAPGLTTPA